MNKPIILSLYGVTLWITVSRWYQAGGKGMPDPATIGPATYLFAVLAIAADFLEGLPVILAAALTFILWQRAPARVATGGSTSKIGTPNPNKPPNVTPGPPGTQGPVGRTGSPVGKTPPGVRGPMTLGGK